MPPGREWRPPCVAALLRDWQALSTARCGTRGAPPRGSCLAVVCGEHPRLPQPSCWMHDEPDSLPGCPQQVPGPLVGPPSPAAPHPHPHTPPITTPTPHPSHTTKHTRTHTPPAPGCRGRGVGSALISSLVQQAGDAPLYLVTIGSRVQLYRRWVGLAGRPGPLETSACSTEAPLRIAAVRSVPAACPVSHGTCMPCATAQPVGRSPRQGSCPSAPVLSDRCGFEEVPASRFGTVPLPLLLEALAGTVVAWLAVRQRLALMQLVSRGGTTSSSTAGAAQSAAAGGDAAAGKG